MKPKLASNAETALVHKILDKYGATPYWRIYRNNVGSGYGLGYVKALLGIIAKGLRGNPIAAIREALAYKGQLISWGVPNSADIMGWMMGGRVVAIECKRPGEKLEKDQATWRLIFESMGGFYIFADKMEDVENALLAAGIIHNQGTENGNKANNTASRA